MRRRGYHPADNSGHLDGSAFDILPPQGRNIPWLKDQVGRIYPKARMLNEGDHLHVTFPGYFGAPALGGAKSAGLKNPLAGIRGAAQLLKTGAAAEDQPLAQLIVDETERIRRLAKPASYP